MCQISTKIKSVKYLPKWDALQMYLWVIFQMRFKISIEAFYPETKLICIWVTDKSAAKMFLMSFLKTYSKWISNTYLSLAPWNQMNAYLRCRWKCIDVFNLRFCRAGSMAVVFLHTVAIFFQNRFRPVTSYKEMPWKF